MRAATMAKKKTAPQAKVSVDRKTIAVTIKGDPAWKQWLEGLANHCRLDIAKVIDRAVIDYAKREGYAREAPRR
jgi:hypothetical protein